VQAIIRLGLVALVMVGLLAGCAGSDKPRDGALTQNQARATIRAALEDIENIYIRETKASELVEAGLAAIHDRHPEVAFSRQDKAIVATVDGKQAYRLVAEPKGGSAKDWAEEVAPALRHIGEALPAEDRPDIAALTDIFLDGVTDSLDELSRYASSADARELQARRDGISGNINIAVERGDDGQFQVKYIFSVDLLESKALRLGDTILSIDGTAVEPLSKSEVLRLFLGETGSAVELSVLHEGASQPLTVTVQREKLGANTVAARAEGKLLRIIMTKFDEPGQDDLKRLLVQQSRDTDSMGVILDLRGNPGGLLSATVETADSFLASGAIVTIHGRHQDSHQYFKAKPTPLGKRPVVVLVDERSASGAEIVASALQDNGAALVIGSGTYGSGTIQTVLALPNGGELILTFGEVYMPGGYRLDRRGIMPTVCTGGDVTAEAVIAGLRKGDGVIDDATRTQDIDPENAASVEAFRSLCPPRSDDADDVGLTVAKALLSDPALYPAVLAHAEAPKQAAAQ